jgi:O-acetyl-ADP-ribose deacetylase (regulator of RNase III)
MSGSLERLEADAIIVASEPDGRPAGAVARDVHEAAGRDFAPKFRSQSQYLELGKALVTSGRKLPARSAIHTPGLVSQPPLILETAYTAALGLVNGTQIRTVGLSPDPGDSPCEAAATVALRSIRAFLENDDNIAKVDHIVVVVPEWRHQDVHYKLIPQFFPVETPKWEKTLDELEPWTVAGPAFLSSSGKRVPPRYPKRDDVNARLSFWMRGDSARLQADAIMNAANEELTAGGGICGVIHNAAGPELAKECDTIGWTETGKAVRTRGYNLVAKYVIHAVGPTCEDPVALRSAYDETLKHIDGVEIRSVGLCCISTGIFGHPIVPATHIALQSVREFLDVPENLAKTDRIVFVVFEPRDVQVYYDLVFEYFPVEEGEVPLPDEVPDENRKTTVNVIFG